MWREREKHAEWNMHKCIVNINILLIIYLYYKIQNMLLIYILF